MKIINQDELIIRRMAKAIARLDTYRIKFPVHRAAAYMQADIEIRHIFDFDETAYMVELARRAGEENDR